MFLGWIRVGAIPDVTTGLEMVTPLLFTELVNTSDPTAMFDRGSPDIFASSSADLPRGEAAFSLARMRETLLDLIGQFVSSCARCSLTTDLQSGVSVIKEVEKLILLSASTLYVSNKNNISFMHNLTLNSHVKEM